MIVTDANGAVLPGATVSGTWSGLFSGRVSARTGRRGDAILSTPTLPATARGSLTFTVDSITLNGYTYNASGNSATSATISR